MTKRLVWLCITGFIAAALVPMAAHARSTYYTAQGCADCHGTTTTCKGCHYHGRTVTATPDKTTFAPGETITVTVSGGSQSGWIKGAILDASNQLVAQASGTATPFTVTVAAPTTPGTYSWKAGWYGNTYNTGGGTGWIADPNNSDHGFQPVALTFTVSAPPVSQPVATLTPATVAVGSVTVGQSGSGTATLGNTGNAVLQVTAVAPCSNTSPPFTLSPSGAFSVAAGASQALSVSFAPTSSGAATGCFNLATNDPAKPTVTLNVTGTGSAVPVPSATLTPASLAFGSVTVGQTSTLTAAVRNTGAAALSVTSVTTCDSSSSPAFTLSPTSAFTVAAGASQTLTLAFAPTASGAAAGCYQLATNDPANATLRLQLTGTGASVTPPPPPPPASCTTCHGAPPSTGKHSTHGGEGCAACHGTGYDASARTVNATLHQNGASDVAASAGYSKASQSCSNSCHGTQSWGGGTPPPPPPPNTGSCTSCHATPPATGKHAKHAKERVACKSCHGSGYDVARKAVNATLHQNGKADLTSSMRWNTAKRSCSPGCHGSEKWGGSGGTTPPPAASCTSCHGAPPSTGEHAEHSSRACSACHGSGYSATARTVDASLHQNGSANVAAAAGWNGSSRSCSNSCHGSESWGGSSGGNPGTGQCGSCHAVPPGSGEHSKHVKEERVSCGSCHGSGFSSSSVNASLHANGTTNLSSSAGWNGSRQSCSNRCHGSESWRGGDDEEEEDDFAAGSELAGGCSSTGATATWAALTGLGLLAARRRRTR